ncbi:MAG: metal-dependent hydrolase [Thermoleophilaceae bacterium]|nr:metal-dependent hydrolase [Thermoleophilaceae bacterium]
MRGWAAAAAALVVAGADLVLHLRRPRWILIALFDHPAHVATAALMALNLRDRSPRWHAGFLAGSLLPDVDHIPLAIGEHPTPETRRPATHSLLAVAPLFALARASRSELADGTAWGTLAHFARDVAVPPGAPLLKPFREEDVLLPYAAYALALVGLAGMAMTR